MANIKTQAQEHIRQLIDLFDVENNSHSEMRVKELEDQNAALKTVNTDLELISKKFEQMTSCSICDEKYESTGERAPVKLKCSHVFCLNCANNWLKSQVVLVSLDKRTKFIRGTNHLVHPAESPIAAKIFDLLT